METLSRLQRGFGQIIVVPTQNYPAVRKHPLARKLHELLQHKSPTFDNFVQMLLCAKGEMESFKSPVLIGCGCHVRGEASAE